MGDDDSGMGGKLLKWGFLLLLCGIFSPLILIPWFLWKYVKLCILFYFKMLYLIIRFPIWLFIQLPLYFIGVGVHKISNAFSKAYGLIMAKKKRYGLLFGILFFFTITTFLPSNTDAMISFITDATLILPFVFFIPFFLTFLVAFISAHFSMPDIARKEMPGGMNTGMKRRTAEAGSAAAAAGAVGMKAYKNKEELSAAKETAQGLAEGAMDTAEAAGEGALAGDMVAVMEGMPILGTMVEGGGAAAAAGGSTATAIAGMSGGTAIAAFILVLFLGFLGFIAISLILSAALWGLLMWFASILGPVISPILAAVGLGQAYGNWIGQTISNTFLPQINLDSEMRMVEQAGAKVGCFLQGPSCIRQWRLNNTARPGSQDVGEEYKLAVNTFSAGGQGGVDIAYKKHDYHIPVSFLLLNTRNGLKGISARDVRYKVRIVDGSREGRKAYCSTKWKEVEGVAYSDDGTILPGTSFSPTVTEMEGLTLEKCDMLHPALGHTYTARLDVQYDYSSRSTLYLEAMTREHMTDEQIRPEFKKSKTADTPVETFINAKAPVNYVLDEEGNPSAIPFVVKVGTATDRFDVEYTVDEENFELRDSSKTEHVPDSCTGLDHESGNLYTLSDRAKDRISNRVEENDIRTWFDKSKNPTPARCTFELSNPGTVSPTGETLTMSVDANYTVNIEKTSSPFDVKNTRCSRFDCPILFRLNPGEFDQLLGSGDGELPPEQWETEYLDPQITDRYELWQDAHCDGLDAGNGCSYTDEYTWNYEPDDIQGGIDSGDIAVQWNSGTANTRDLFSCHLRANPTGDDAPEGDAIGIGPNQINKVLGEPTKRLNYTSGGFEVVEYRRKISNANEYAWVVEVKKTVTQEATSCNGASPNWQKVSGEWKVDYSLG